MTWGAGWCPPLLAPAEASAVTTADLLDATSPMWGLDRLWGWQRHALAVLDSRRADDPSRPRYLTVAVVVPRQSGKTTLLQLVVWLGLQRGQKVLYTLHQRQRGRERWEEIAGRLAAVDKASYQVTRRIGGERITHRSTGGWCQLVTPDDAGGRSFTADIIIVDEAAFISPRFLRAARGTRITRSAAQVVMISSAGTETSDDLAAARQAASDGSETVAYLAWGAADGTRLDNIDLDAPEVQAAAMPTLGQPGGIQQKIIDAERLELDDVTFAREYLGIWSGAPELTAIDMDAWTACSADFSTEPAGAAWLALHTSPLQEVSAVAVARSGDAGSVDAWIESSGPGMAWLLDEVVELVDAHKAIGVCIDARSPAIAHEEQLLQRGVPVVRTGSNILARCCAHLTLQLAAGRIRLPPDSELDKAARNARRRIIEDVGWTYRQADHPESALLAALTLAAGHAADQAAGASAVADWADGGRPGSDPETSVDHMATSEAAPVGTMDADARHDARPSGVARSDPHDRRGRSRNAPRRRH